MVNKIDIHNIMYALTLADRPRYKEKWVKGGWFRRFGEKRLFSYWKRRLDKANHNDLKLYEITLSLYQRRRFHPENYAWLGENLPSGWLPQEKKMKLASEGEISERQAKCFECEYYDPIAFNGAGRCKKNWCPTIAMTSFSSNECPSGRWSVCL